MSSTGSHSRGDNFEAPDEFRPDRFVGQSPPTDTWIPFGAAYDIESVGTDVPKVCNLTSAPRRRAPDPGARLTETPVRVGPDGWDHCRP
ncbi:MAG: hypothetical protein ACR2K3_04320 [Nocardioides sp.]